MRILFLGDIVGQKATAHVARRVPELRAELNLDIVIANGDNCVISGVDPMTGSGLDRLSAELLLSHEVDVITTGFHAFDSPDCAEVLGYERVLRSHNRLHHSPGKGILHIEHANGSLTLINLATTRLVDTDHSAYETFQHVEKRGVTLVHSVGDPHETRVLAYAIDGEAAAVLGTFGHEPTLRDYRLPRGTVLVPDVGMVGPVGGIGGFDPRYFVAQAKGEDASNSLPYFLLEDHPMTFDAVLLECDTREVVRIVRHSEIFTLR